MDTNILKTYTKQNHSRAEQTEFMRALISGNYDKDLWINHLTNNYLAYSFIESKLPNLKNLGLNRAEFLYNDLQGEYGKVVSSTYELLNRLGNLDTIQLYAHVYVRWLGDLNGGKFIAKQCKFSHSYLIWEDPTQSIKLIKEIIHPIQDKITDESVIAFDSITRICNELL